MFASGAYYRNWPLNPTTRESPSSSLQDWEQGSPPLNSSLNNLENKIESLVGMNHSKKMTHLDLLLNRSLNGRRCFRIGCVAAGCGGDVDLGRFVLGPSRLLKSKRECV